MSQGLSLRRVIAVMSALLAAVLGAPVLAQSVVVSGFANQYADNNASAGIGLDYLAPERFHFGTLTYGFGAGTSFDSEQNFWIGTGLAFTVAASEKWYVEGSVMPGYYSAGGDEYDLGSDFEVRSLIGLGYRLNERSSLSLGLSHTSNGGLGETNPGMNALSLRFRTGL